MKKILNVVLFSAILASMSLSVSSCKKDETTTPSGGGSSNTSSSGLETGKAVIKANVTGSATTNYESTAISSIVVKNGSLISINTSNLSTTLNLDQYIIILPANITTGSYKATDFGGEAGGIFQFSRAEGGAVTGAWQADPDGETVFNFTITKATATEIEGTFDGEMSTDENETKVKTVGSFAAKY